jgi:hypothetical protein
MAFNRLPIFLGIITLSVLVSCNSKSTSKESKNNSSSLPEISMTSQAPDEGVEIRNNSTKKESIKPNNQKEAVGLPLELEKRFPNEAMNEKNDKPKQSGVTRNHENEIKVLDILLPNRKTSEEDKLQSNVKKGAMPSFIPCDPKDLPIIRVTETRFVDERYPTISANGDYLVYEGWHRPESGEVSSEALYCIKLDDTLSKTVLLKNGFNNVRPFFHPNLKEVFFATDSFHNEFHISSVALDSNATANLNFRKYCRDVIDISISKNADFAISYFKEGKTNSSIGMVNSSGIFLPEIAEGREVTWSQKGDRISFVNYNGVYLDVYTAKPDGTDLLQITTHFGISHHPSFSPDDKWLVFSALIEGNKKYNLFMVSKDGKDLLQLTNSSEHDKNPFWGKDGWIYFETERFEGNTEIAKIDSAPFIKKFEDKKIPPVFLK